MKEIKIPLTDEQYEAIERLIALPIAGGRWATAEAFLAEHVAQAIQIAFKHAPPEAIVEKRNQIAQIQAEIDNYARPENVQIVSAAEPAELTQGG